MFNVSFDPSNNAHNKLERLLMLDHFAPNTRNV